MINGRWDLMVEMDNGAYPAWVELHGAESRFVGRWGSARPVETVRIEGDRVHWSLPPQYEGRKDDLVFNGRLEGDQLVGTYVDEAGKTVGWTGKRAPSLERSAEPTWGEPIDLIGPDLSNWTSRSPELANHWSIVDDMLYNNEVGTDLVTVDRFMDFKLVAEYKYPPGSNSGIYLRGRYEFQILDDYGHGNGVCNSGAIYGFIAPARNAVKPADEWNLAELTLVGRQLTVVLNGETIIENSEIPGITGGALDCEEGVPGPIFLQGDHGPVVFRRLTLTPAG